MTTKNHVIFWSGAFVALLMFVYVFSVALLPFVLGFAIAYFLNPFVGELGKLGLPRGPAALFILFMFFVFVFGFVAAVVPLAYDQFVQLSSDFPGYVDGVWTWLQPLSTKLQELTGQGEVADFRALLKEHVSAAFSVGTSVGSKLAQGLWAGGQAFMNLISVTIFTPIVAYFMIKEWDHISAWVLDLMPLQQKKTIMGLLEQIDGKLSGFIRGQITVAFILGLAYALALSVAGLKYGFLIGLLSGALSIIPMVGSTVGLVVSVLVAWMQSGAWLFTLVIAAIFLIGQFIEGNLLTPKLMGKNVGLHPLWVFFSLLTGGALFGVIGMFLAVPVAAVIGVMIAFALKKYKASAYYKGPAAKKKPVRKGKKNA